METLDAATRSEKHRITDDLDLLFDVLPPAVRAAIADGPDPESLIEVVLDLGRTPEARYPGRAEPLALPPTSREELRWVVEHVSRFGKDNRAGIERTLHRISAIRNRQGEIIGLTCRVGRAVVGTIDIVRDVIESGRGVLLLGRPGVGKTTLLREAARVLADDLGKRVVVVDTSNEIAGDGDVPHPAIGRARRMQVAEPEAQHAVMIEAVENHMPEVIVIDEIGTLAEAMASRTIAERGVQLIATAHGNTLENLLQNPTLSDLVGGIHAVTLSDEEARRRGTQKTVLERKAPPTFSVVVEIHEKDRLAVHHEVAEVVDRFLRGGLLRPEERRRKEDGEVEIEARESEPEKTADHDERPFGTAPAPRRRKLLRVFPYAVSRSKIERAIRDLRVPATIVDQLRDADVVLTLKAQERRQPQRLRDAEMRGLRFAVVKNNTVHQIESFLRAEFDLDDTTERQRLALAETEIAINEVLDTGQPIELEVQDRNIRRLQHELIDQAGLVSQSRGQEPLRRVVIFPG